MPCRQNKLWYEEQSSPIQCVNDLELLLRTHCMHYGLVLSLILLGLIQHCGTFEIQLVLWILKSLYHG